MKNKVFNFKKITSTICNLLIAASPLILSKTACFFSWGEPECPEILKNDIESS